MTGAVCRKLADGRLHLQHGPIDIIAQCWGEQQAVAEGEARICARFKTVLDELVSELPLLRAVDERPEGAVAQRMASAVAPFRPAFITPMAAVAGAVADTLLAALGQDGLTRAYVNNGGDIALHLAPGHELTCAVVTGAGQPATITLRAEDPVRGIATSGWRGRSWSLGIADSVTVLAQTAAQADAAATMIANAVDLPGHPDIRRTPAYKLQSDSDLGARPVTTHVPPLSPSEIAQALTAGENAALAYRARGLIVSAALFLQSQQRSLGALTLKDPARV